MREHFYLHTTNLDIIKQLQKDSLFKPVFKYNSINEIPYIHKNEYGKIITKENYFHILIGKIRQKGCAWCESSLKVVSEHIPDSFPNDKNKFSFYCVCEKCGSRGPKTYLYINDDSDEIKNQIKQRIVQKYEDRISWDNSEEFRKEKNDS